jgi:hypothetical protein
MAERQWTAADSWVRANPPK